MPYLWCLWPFMCSLLNRMRGGLFGDRIRDLTPSVRLWGTTTARLSTTACMLLPILFQEGCTVFLCAWTCLYVGFIFRWEPWQEMNTVPNDIFAMCVRGIILTGPLAFVLGSYIVALVALAMGPCYYIGLKIQQKYGPFQTNVEWAEWVFGSLLGLSIVLSSHL